MDIQSLIDTFNAVGKDTRSAYHLTIGKFIEFLQTVDENADVMTDQGGSICSPHSYRGYYSDLSFEPTSRVIQNVRRVWRVSDTIVF